MQMEENTQPFWRLDKVLTPLFLGHEESVHVQLTARINYVSKAALKAKAFKKIKKLKNYKKKQSELSILNQEMNQLLHYLKN